MSVPDAHRRPVQPFHLLVPVAAIASLLLATRPVADPDVYWHVRLGADILRRHSVHGAGSGWSILPPAHPWTSPEWLSDLALHGVVAAFGWRGMLVFQVAASVAFLVGLAWAVLPGRDARAGAVVYAVTAVSLASYLQPRPQTLSLVLLTWVSVQTRNVLASGRLPRLRWFLPLVWVWAQLHGLWLLAPAAIALAVAVRLLDDRGPAELDRLRRGALVVAAGLAVGCVNPLGLTSLTLPFRLRAATSTIAEWHPTTFRHYFTWGLLVLLGALVVAWARRGRPVPRAEIAWAAALTLFALTAYRNVAVSTVLLAPIAADRLRRPDREVPVGEREERLLRIAVASCVVAAVAVAAVATATVTPIPDTSPVRLARQLDDGSPHRVLDDYNTGGIVLAFGGPRVRVAVDGRADYYGGPYLDRYADMMQMSAGWQTLFDRLDPDTAVISTTVPLHEWMTTNGWREVARQGSYALLVKGSG